MGDGEKSQNSGFDPKKMPSAKEYFGFKEVALYFFRKKDPNRPSSFNLKAMHTINKISMSIFLLCVIIMIVRALT